MSSEEKAQLKAPEWKCQIFTFDNFSHCQTSAQPEEERERERVLVLIIIINEWQCDRRF